MDARCLVRVGVGVLLMLAGCGQGQPGGEPSPTLSLDWQQMEQRRIEASQRAEARASASATASPTPAGPYVWKEIPEPILPPEAQAQAGFAEAELAAKYFVELQYYVAQTNDLATWEQVIHPESPSGKQVIENTHKRQADLVRLVHEGLSISPLRAEQGQEDVDLFRVFLEVHMADELTISSDGREIDSDGDRTLYVTSYVKHLEGRWLLVDSSFSEERPEGL